MADDREQELERLERELLADEVIDDDDLLSDIPIELLDTRPLSWTEDDDLLIEELISETPEEPEVPQEIEVPQETETHDGEIMSNGKKKATKKTKADQKREDRWLITLMIIASFLCVGIIGILIYWLEVFLK